MKAIIGTANKGKVAAAEKLLQQLMSQSISVTGYNASSGVADAPWDAETLEGARNRAKECMNAGEADYYIGLESGLTTRWGVAFEEAWAVVITPDGKEGVAYSSGIPIPQSIIAIMEVRSLTHDKAMRLVDELLENMDARLNRDTWHTYTGGQLARSVSFDEALRNAILQVVGHEASLYHKQLLNNKM